MTQNNLKPHIGKLIPQKRRGVAEVISTLLLVVITVAGAVILTGFIDESFVSGSLAVTSGTDTTIKTIRMLGYDTRNGDELMAIVAYDLHNTGVPNVLCRDTCNGDPEETPDSGGSDFMVIQIENRSVNSIFLKSLVLDGIVHPYDENTFPKTLNTSAATSAGGDYPADGFFSILPSDTTVLTQGDNELAGGEAVNLLVKLDTANDDIELSKTMRVQINLGEESLADFLIETGDAR